MPGFPIRKSPDQSLLSGSPKLIAASHALHRLLAPRHSPCALNSLTTMQEHPCACTRRLPVHTYSVVKDRREPVGPAKLISWLPRLPYDEGARANQLESKTATNGADGHRTHDPRLAKPVLSQLSYSPTPKTGSMGLGRIELPTSPLSGVRSSQLSYRPTSCEQNRLRLNSSRVLKLNSGKAQ